jgi:hypothetical protein
MPIMPTPLKELKESCDICALPRCRTESCLDIWLDEKRFGLCKHHWMQYCDPDLEPKIRKQLKVLQRPAKENKNETAEALISICSRVANSPVLRVPSVTSGNQDDRLGEGD